MNNFFPSWILSICEVFSREYELFFGFVKVFFRESLSKDHQTRKLWSSILRFFGTQKLMSAKVPTPNVEPDLRYGHF